MSTGSSSNSLKTIPPEYQPCEYPPYYRRAMSDPILKKADHIQRKYEMRKFAASFSENLIRDTSYIKRPSISSELNALLIKNLQPFAQDEIESSQKLKAESSRKKPLKNQRFKMKKRFKRNIESIETPSLMTSDHSFKKKIVPVEEPKLYRMLNEVILDIANVMSNRVLKKSLRQKRMSYLLKTSDFSFLDMNHFSEAELNETQSQLQAKGLYVSLKPLPNKMPAYLKRRCSLWKLKGRRYSKGSLSTSLSLNPSSVEKEDQSTEVRTAHEEEDSADNLEPKNNIRILNRLITECTVDDTFNRILEKHSLDYKISPHDYLDVYAHDVAKRKNKIQELTGSDKIRLNKRTTMLNLNQKMQKNNKKEIEKSQRTLKDEEDRRIRLLKVMGIISETYDENEIKSNKNKLIEKPHISYNSVRPIFSENPCAGLYKAIVKEIHRDVILKTKEEDDVLSIGEVSFVSDSSSLDGKEHVQIENVLSNENKGLQGGLQETIREVCNKYMNFGRKLIVQLQKENNMEKLFSLASGVLNKNLIELYPSLETELDQ